MNSYSTSWWSLLSLLLRLRLFKLIWRFEMSLHYYYYYLLLIYRPHEDERLSWPCWLTYSGWFTHINGYPSAAGPVQASESSPVRDRRSTTEPPNQLWSASVYMVSDNIIILNDIWWIACFEYLNCMSSRLIKCHQQSCLVYSVSSCSQLQVQCRNHNATQ